MKIFWKDLPKGFSVLAPMDGVTDVVFRQIIVQIGKPDVLFTEFTNCDGLMSSGRDHVIERLLFKPNEHPIVAQIWGVNPETFYESAKLIASLGFDGIDINMGCPHRTIVADGACSALIKTPGLAAKLIEATKKGSKGLPVSVKTRIGLKDNQIDEWISFLLKQELAALTIHLRTAKEQSLVPAHWELMHAIVALKDQIHPDTVIIGNGDIKTLEEAKQKIKDTACDGIMIGRGIFANPWLFTPTSKKEQIAIQERFALFLNHINLFEQTWGKEKNPALLKKFCKMYINGFEGASAIREEIMQTSDLLSLHDIVQKYAVNSHVIHSS